MGEVLAPGINSQYWSYIDRLPGAYTKDVNAVPFFSETGTNFLVFIDFIPSLFNPSAPTYVRVFLDAYELASSPVLVRDVEGLILCPFQLPSPGEFLIEIKSSDLSLTYSQCRFNAKNMYALTEAYAVEMSSLRTSQQSEKWDFIWNQVNDDRIQDNFGSLMNINNPIIFTLDQYRAMLLGNDFVPGMRRAFFGAGSIRGVFDAVRSVTGVDPIMTRMRTLDTFTTFDRPLGIDPTATPEYYSFDSDASPGFDEDEVVTTYDGRYLDFAIQLACHGAIWPWVGAAPLQESVLRNPAAATMNDGLNNQFLTSDPVTIPGYIENTDFTVDRPNGIITWIGAPQPLPPDRSTYVASYRFEMRDIIIPLANAVKPAVSNIIYEFLD